MSSREQSLALFNYNQVYFVKFGNEMVIRKMVLTNEELIWNGVYNFWYKRTLTIAGIGEVCLYINENGDKFRTINGNREDFKLHTYTDLEGTILPNTSVHFNGFIVEKFAKLHNLEVANVFYHGKEMICYKWNGIKAIREELSFYQILQKGGLYSLVSPTFTDDDFKRMGIYKTKTECEKNNDVVLVDFSY